MTLAEVLAEHISHEPRGKTLPKVSWRSPEHSESIFNKATSVHFFFFSAKKWTYEFLVQTHSISIVSWQMRYWHSVAQGSLILDFSLKVWNDLGELGSPFTTDRSCYVNPTYNSGAVCVNYCMWRWDCAPWNWCIGLEITMCNMFLIL